MQRLQNVASNLVPQTVAAKSDDDVVICSAVRTPVTKGKRGGLKDTAPEFLLSVVLREAATRAKVNPADVQDIAVGNNLLPGAGEIPNRMAMFMAGFPDTTSIVAVNRLCSSGL
jgi:acetyl-CoA acyltransferase 1